MHARRIFAASLLLLAACASGNNRPAGFVEPDVRIRQRGGAPFFGSGYTAAVDFDVVVTNRSPAPIVIRRIELQSPGMMQYAIYPVERFYRDTIDPNQTRVFQIGATAYTEISRLAATEPLTIRVTADLEAGNGELKWREVYLSRAVE